MSVVSFSLARVSDGTKVDLQILNDDSLRCRQDGLVESFCMYVGQDANGNDLGVPYVLNTDCSAEFKLKLKDGFTTGFRTVKGTISGANQTKAVAKGPMAMRAGAVRGGVLGFAVGAMIVLARDIGAYVYHEINNSKTYPHHFYVAPAGSGTEDFFGPTYLNMKK